MTLRIVCALAAGLALSALAQTSQKIDVKKGKVVYVSGQDLVVKMADGAVKHIVVPDDFKFHVNGKDIGIQDLKVGTELTQTITTTTADTEVTNVRNIDVVVKDVQAPYVLVQSPDGASTKRVKVPDGTKFTIDGSPKTVFDLKPGMKLKGTIVTTTPQVVVSSKQKVTGKAPATPPVAGALLIEESH
jgi:hypothetical protein